jgi:hypothetical protein
MSWTGLSEPEVVRFWPVAQMVFVGQLPCPEVPVIEARLPCGRFGVHVPARRAATGDLPDAATAAGGFRRQTAQCVVAGAA